MAAAASSRLALVLSVVAFAGCGAEDIERGVDSVNKRYDQLCRDANRVKLPPGVTPDEAERFREENCPKQQTEKGKP